ncbi:uncharacterized protein B0T15DRAFT_525549 [Chaetomium strumarium]|uniref:Uncharacterized protein n=1 Tax=Chaetomium strumarium TaxID=1170767 RepID=A0AAJ0M4L3_9PEZI|nr:hypothetical protein B0T15DRAFT_525549 [Chaetomium strumarium]
MEQPTPLMGPGPNGLAPAPNRPPAPARKRSSSGAGGLLSKFPFMRSVGEHRPRSRRNTIESEPGGQAPSLPTPSFVTIPAEEPQRQVAAAGAAPPALPHINQLQSLLSPQQQKTRRRRGSLRKVALLGRGAQRERRDSRSSTIDPQLEVNGANGRPAESAVSGAAALTSSPVQIDGSPREIPMRKNSGGDPLPLGLGISDLTPRPSMDGYAIRSDTSTPDPVTPTAAPAPRKCVPESSPSINYSTTDDEDALHMARRNGPITVSNQTPSTLSLSSTASLVRPERASVSSGSESYYLGPPHARPPGTGNGGLPSIQRRRSVNQRAKSPLALSSLAAPLSPPDADWDYAETEWWGWIILVVTWFVFVVGMGSCLGVWSWAWDVGTTPYAPPELEDDPTLPIVGYYPALMILTGVMAWVWVVVAWVGMKYFRHAQVSGD